MAARSSANPGCHVTGCDSARATSRSNMRSHTITCPAGQTESFVPGEVVEFDADVCARCPLRAQCTSAAAGYGRTVAIANHEQLQHRLRKLVASPKGANACASARRSSTRSPISHGNKVAALGISECGRTSSTFAVMQPSSTSRPYIAGRRQSPRDSRVNRTVRRSKESKSTRATWFARDEARHSRARNNCIERARP